MKTSSGPSTAPREWTIWRVLGNELNRWYVGEVDDRIPSEEIESYVVVERASLDRVVEERDELREQLEDARDRLVDVWHNEDAAAAIGETPLHEFLGMTWERYARWTENPAALQSGEG